MKVGKCDIWRWAGAFREFFIGTVLDRSLLFFFWYNELLMSDQDKLWRFFTIKGTHRLGVVAGVEVLVDGFITLS